MNIIEQLVDIYYRHEWWHKNKMEPATAFRYHTKLYNQGNVQCHEEMGVLLGYYEVWFINEKQLGNIVIGRRFTADSEDITSGDIAYLANCWIDPNFRRGRVFKDLYLRFMEQTRKCRVYAGETAKRKFKLNIFKRRQVWAAKNKVLLGQQL